MDMPRLYKVIRSYQSPYADPLRLAHGDRVTILPRPSEWPGWLWCRDANGKTGWAPEAFLSRTDAEARLARDYDAVELSVEPGETIRPVLELAGWVWGTDDRGKTGWVPRDHLEIPYP